MYVCLVCRFKNIPLSSTSVCLYPYYVLLERHDGEAASIIYGAKVEYSTQQYQIHVDWDQRYPASYASKE